MFDHCVRVYAQMLSESEVQVDADTIDDNGGDSDESDVMVVWSGRYTKLIHDLNYSVPYYTAIKKNLVRMGCIQQLRRGGGTAPSVWWLKAAPTEEAFRNAVERKVPDAKDAFQQQLGDLNRRLSKAERTIQALIDGKVDV